MNIQKHTATLLMMTLVGLSGLTSAQTSAGITAQVPFDFVANGKAMPAGECTITIAESNGLLSVTSGKEHAYALPTTDNSANAAKKTPLVFHHYGRQYFLVAIKVEGATGYQLPKSRVERELQARNVPWQEFTLLASAR